MKKNVIAFLLAVIMASGSIGTVPALAAETTAQEAVAVEKEKEDLLKAMKKRLRRIQRNQQGTLGHPKNQHQLRDLEQPMKQYQLSTPRQLKKPKKPRTQQMKKTLLLLLIHLQRSHRLKNLM